MLGSMFSYCFFNLLLTGQDPTECVHLMLSVKVRVPEHKLQLTGYDLWTDRFVEPLDGNWVPHKSLLHTSTAIQSLLRMGKHLSIAFSCILITIY